MAFYEEVALALEKIGLIDVILPFLLFFALTFALFDRSKVLGDNRNACLMIAFVFGFLGVATLQLVKVVSLISAYFVVIAILGLISAMILTVSGASEYKHTWKITGGILIGLFAISVMYALVQTGVLDWDHFVDVLLLPLILIAAIVGLIVYAIGPRRSRPQGNSGGGNGNTPQPRGPTHIIEPGEDDFGTFRRGRRGG